MSQTLFYNILVNICPYRLTNKSPFLVPVAYQKSIPVLINSFVPSGPVMDNHTWLLLSETDRLKVKKSQQVLSDLINITNWSSISSVPSNLNLYPSFNSFVSKIFSFTNTRTSSFLFAVQGLLIYTPLFLFFHKRRDSHQVMK